MNLMTIVLIAFGLALDALAISITCGVITKKDRLYHAFRFGLSFGFFQMMMPILGWFLASQLSSVVQAFDHWIAFGLLSFIGGKMIYESFQLENKEETKTNISWYVLLGLSIATSIDALAVGMSFAFLKISIMLPAVIVGVITFFVSFLGFLVGHRYGHWIENKIEIIGGCVLIGIGFKILLQHLI